MLRSTLFAAATAIALTATPAAAQGFDFGIKLDDFRLRIGVGDDHHRHGRQHYRGNRHHRTHHQVVRHTTHRHHHQTQRRWVPGHYVNEQVRRWVEGYYENVHVPAQYRTETYYGSCGTLFTRQVLVAPARYERVWRPGYWTVDTENRWVPGHWEEY